MTNVPVTGPAPVPDVTHAVAAATKVELPRDHWFTRRPSLAGLAPDRVEPWAGVVATCHRVVREQWSRDTELGERLFERLRTQQNRATDLAAVQQYQELDPSRPPEPQACSNCSLRPGLGPCPRCLGTGFLTTSYESGHDIMVRCSCEAGFATCTVCDGTTRTVLASVRYVVDTPSREVFVAVPKETGVDPSALSFALASPHFLDDAYAFDPNPGALHSAYRGPGTAAVPPFQGFQFGDAAASALQWATGAGAGAPAVRHVFRAVPFFLLHFTVHKSPLKILVWLNQLGSHEAALAEMSGR